MEFYQLKQKYKRYRQLGLNPIMAIKKVKGKK